MTQQPLESTTWGGRADALRRAATTVLAAVSFAAVVPTIANAAGADLPNPVFFALRGAGRTLAGGPDCATPDATPTGLPSAEPVASAGAEPPPSASAAAAGCEEEGGDRVVEASPSVSPPASPEASESEAPEAADGDGEHGAVVSTVAKCAPRGKDPLFQTLGDDLANHGAFVRAAAHGGTLTTPWGSFDLSTRAGADALCARIEAARAELDAASGPEDERAGKGRGKGKAKDKGGKGGRPKPRAD